MVRSHTVMVWSDYLPKKSLVVVSGGGWQTKFNVSPGPGLWSLVLGPFGPDLGPDLGPGPGPELDKKEEKDDPNNISGQDRLIPSSSRSESADGEVEASITSDERK